MRWKIMKKKDKRLISLMICCAAAFLITVLSIQVCAESETESTPVQLIYEYANAVNEHNVWKYISLFESEIQEEMKEYIRDCGTDEFFSTERREIISIAAENDQIAAQEKEMFSDVLVFRVRENIIYSANDLKMNSGINEHNYVLIKEDGEWKIYRISGVENTNTKSRASAISCPSEITVYFTKSTNYNYYGVRTKTLPFSTYLNNVLPEEWYISYFHSYPAYGYAGALASKMYAWYYTENPKWDFEPYYADVKDNSSDQNFLYNSRAALSSNYRTYEDTVLMYIDRLAILNGGTDDIFEIHYHATDGTQYSGQMSQSGCLSMAMNGDSYDTILRYYYDYSTYIGTSNRINITNY